MSKWLVANDISKFHTAEKFDDVGCTIRPRMYNKTQDDILDPCFVVRFAWFYIHPWSSGSLS